MNLKVTVLTILGFIVALLGTLWVVQGLGLIQIGPVLCVANCEPISGNSMQWTVIGVLTLSLSSERITPFTAGVNRIGRLRKPRTTAH